MSILSTIVAPLPGVITEEAEEELLIYRPDQGSTVYLNGPAATIYRLLDGQRSGTDIASILADAYPEAGEQIQEDTAQALADLVERGLARQC